MERLKNLWKYSGKYKYAFVLLPIAVAADVFIEILIPYFMGQMMNEGIPNQDINIMLMQGSFMVLASIVLVGIGLLESYLVTAWASGVAQNLRNELFKQINALPLVDTDHFGSASIVTRLTTDMNFIKRALEIYHSLLRCPITLIFTIIVTVQIYPAVSGIFLIASVLFALIIGIGVKFGLIYYRKMFNCYDGVNNVLEENISSAKTVKAYAQEEYEAKQFDKKINKLRENTLKAQKITVLNEPLLNLIMDMCILAVLCLGGFNIISGQMQPGDLFCVITYTVQILVQLYIVALILVPVLSSQVALDRVFEVINTRPSFNDKAESSLQVIDGSVQFNHVDFSYYADKNKLVLRDINLDIKPGEFVGIIGSSGSGKSTLLSLILHLYECTNGSLFVGKHSIKDYSYENLREGIGIVPQHSFLFSGSIKDNLLWGNSEASPKEIVDACVTADANDFVMSFTEGYDTKIEQGGNNVSGGQKQRLCIARALLNKNNKILMFDDSLSAVDNVTEQNIISSLKTNYTETTILMVSQKFSTIKGADKIVVMNNGQIEAVGIHDNLLKESKTYKEIYDTQNRNLE